MSHGMRALALCSLFVFAGGAAAQDWNSAASAETIQVITHDEDGALRETTIWLAVYQGHGYIRTGGTKWGANVRRSPDVAVRIGNDEYALRAVSIPPRDATYAAVTDVFRQKYGFPDSVMGILRSLGGPATIMRLDPR